MRWKGKKERKKKEYREKSRVIGYERDGMKGRIKRVKRRETREERNDIRLWKRDVMKRTVKKEERIEKLGGMIDNK